ncbi:MAG TPA: cytochrome c [Acidobacteriaceae bacterium]|jgi:mono/diheme cytochrome c family protein|nr:cytochrome c [Acidobacteriaceae bacterium]
MRRMGGVAWFVLGCAVLAAAAEVNQDWLKRVPAAERTRVNPYSGQADAVAAGSRLYADRCARCHGADLLGLHGKPSLKTNVVAGATDGELFWLLRNGDLRHGMPSWSGLPEPERWQIVAFLRAENSK